MTKKIKTVKAQRKIRINGKLCSIPKQAKYYAFDKIGLCTWFNRKANKGEIYSVWYLSSKFRRNERGKDWDWIDKARHPGKYTAWDQSLHKIIED